MKFKVLLLSILAFFITIVLAAQDLPEAWQISSDGRMMTAGGENNDGFYGQYKIQDVELEFSESNWWDILEGNYESGTDLLATCWINGVRYDSVGVRFKGATSYFRNNTEKKSFNITLDYIIDGQDIEGYNTFNLNCGWEDNSSMKEVLFNNIGQHYYMSLKSNYANLVINGSNWGPYQNVQQFDSDYIKEWFLSNNGTIWRAERIDFVPGTGGGPNGPDFGAGSSSLNYNGSDSTNYNEDYTLKRTEQEDPWAGMIRACDILNNEPLETLEEALLEVFDVDKACWFLAHEVIFSDDDSYVNKGGIDYYIYYEAETGRIVPMEYDGNSVLADDKLNWDLFFNENNTDFPLMNRMLAVPSIRQRYLAHVRVILEDYFNTSFTNEKIDNWLVLIDNLVQDDPKKFYDYDEFISAVSSLKEAILDRRNYLLSDSEMNNISSLNVGSVTYAVDGKQWQRPTEGEDVNVSAIVSGAPGIESVWLYYGAGFTGIFQKVEMYDDGLHNDGGALDGQYGAGIPGLSAGTYVRYYIEAIAADGAGTATFEPKGAEHDVFLYQVGLLTAIDTTVLINELMADNEAATQDAAGEYDDWLELYNLSAEPVDLEGWTLSDDIEELDKFTFPEGSILEADSYLVIWADDDEDQGDFHANFKLSADGESLYLLNADAELVSEVNFPEAIVDLSYSREPNGTGPFKYKPHTIGLSNDLTSDLSEADPISELLVYPNPAETFLVIETETAISHLQVLSGNGQVIYSYSDKVTDIHTIQMGDWNTGIYFIRLEMGNKVLIDKFIKI